MNNDKFTTILTGTFGSEIAVVRSKLESEGIDCFVKNELTAQVLPHISNAVGGVKLQIRESDLARALEILNQTEAPSLETEANESQPDAGETVRKNPDITCPFCGSTEVVKTKKAGWTFLITSLLFMVPTIFLNTRYYCFACKREFKRKQVDLRS